MTHTAGKEDRKDKKEKQILRRRYIGIDLGEYVMAYVVIEACRTKEDRMQVKVIDKGIIRDYQQKVLAEKVKELKRRQRGGSFSAPSTAVADIRESLVGSLRNRFHSLLLKYDAKLIYEYQVSYFEKAGNRIKKVYQSVKMSDCPDNDAQKALSKNVWGARQEKEIHIAKDVSAAYTSQTCSACGRAALDFEALNIQNDIKRALAKRAISRGERRGVFTLNFQDKERLYFYVDDPERFESRKELSIGFIKGAVDSYMRPPLESRKERFVKLKKDGIEGYEVAREVRGNSSLFVCPLSLCNHISDADIQAAYNIALRGAFNDLIANTKKKKQKPLSEVYEMIEGEKPVIKFESRYYRSGDGGKESFIIR